MPYRTKQNKTPSKCLNCGFTFPRISQHLSCSPICNQFYKERRSGGTSNGISTRSQLRQRNNNGNNSRTIQQNTNTRRSARLTNLDTIREVNNTSTNENVSSSNTTNVH